MTRKVDSNVSTCHRLPACTLASLCQTASSMQPDTGPPEVARPTCHSICVQDKGPLTVQSPWKGSHWPRPAQVWAVGIWPRLDGTLSHGCPWSE